MFRIIIPKKGECTAATKNGVKSVWNGSGNARTAVLTEIVPDGDPTEDIYEKYFQGHDAANNIATFVNRPVGFTCSNRKTTSAAFFATLPFLQSCGMLGLVLEWSANFGCKASAEQLKSMCLRYFWNKNTLA